MIKSIKFQLHAFLNYGLFNRLSCSFIVSDEKHFFRSQDLNYYYIFRSQHLNYYINNMGDKLLLKFGAKFQCYFKISHVKLQCCHGNFSYSAKKTP